jgi:hypothetical protein
MTFVLVTKRNGVGNMLIPLAGIQNAHDEEDGLTINYSYGGNGHVESLKAAGTAKELADVVGAIVATRARSPSARSRR